MEVEPAHVRMTGTRRQRLHLLGRVSGSSNARTRPGSKRDETLHRRRGDRGQRRRLFRPPVGRTAAFGIACQPAPLEQAFDSLGDAATTAATRRV